MRRPGGSQLPSSGSAAFRGPSLELVMRALSFHHSFGNAGVGRRQLEGSMWSVSSSEDSEIGGLVAPNVVESANKCGPGSHNSGSGSLRMQTAAGSLLVPPCCLSFGVSNLAAASSSFDVSKTEELVF